MYGTLYNIKMLILQYNQTKMGGVCKIHFWIPWNCVAKNNTKMKRVLVATDNLLEDID